MKKNKIFYSVLFLSMLLLPLLDIAVAQKKPNYTGINVEQTYIWSTTFNKSPFEDYIEDLGYSEEYAENYTDWWFDISEWDEDAEAWKIYIIQIKDEKDMDYRGDEIDYLPYLYNFYDTENRAANDWDDIEKNERGIIPEYDKDFYLDNMAWTFGLFKLFVGTDTDWDELAGEFEDELEDYNEEGSADEETRFYFFNEEECGISTRWDPGFPIEVEEHESVSRYTREGILSYYEWTYGGEVIAQLELEGTFFHEYWWIFVVFAIIALLAIVITVVVVIINKKGKREIIAPPVVKKKPVIPKPSVVRPAIEAPLMVKFCPMCGSKVKATNKFCTSCGASLDE